MSLFLYFFIYYLFIYSCIQYIFLHASLAQVWKGLFVERSPISEACQGVVTTLHRLGASVDGEGLSCRLHLELVGIWFLKIGLAYCPAYVSVLFSFAYGNGNALRFFSHYLMTINYVYTTHPIRFLAVYLHIGG
jgi:hypothetical protein